jgi:hypothetical protein
VNILRRIVDVRTLLATAFELSIVVIALLGMFSAGVAARWLTDTGTLFDEDRTPGTAFIDPPVMPPGTLITVHRLLRRRVFCPAIAAAWLVQDNRTFMHLENFPTFSRPSTVFRDFRLRFWIPSYVPKGDYVLRLYYTCERNPLVTITQILDDIPLTVSDAQ